MQNTQSPERSRQECQTRRLRNRWYRRQRREEPVRFGVDPIGEVEGIGAPVLAPGPEVEGPKAARPEAGDRVDRDRTEERSGDGVEGIDLAVEKAEVTNQQVAAERTETGRRKSDAPRCGKLAADQGLQQGPALSENRHRSRPQGGILLRQTPGRRIGHIDTAVDVLDVERDESQCTDRAGRRKCARAEAHGGEGAVIDVDGAERIVGSVQYGLSLVDG